jgi:hypothetical protein
MGIGKVLITLMRIASALLIANECWADSSENKEISYILRDRKFEEDTRIDDPELRAKAGSLNRYSLQFLMDYLGPAINDLGNPMKPNPDNRPGDPRTVLMGIAGVRYRLTSDVAMNFSTGVAFYEPYQAVSGKQQERPRPGNQNYGVNDPAVAVDKTYILWDTQMRSSLRASFTTNQAFLDRGEVSTASIFHEMKHKLGISRYTAGANLIGQYLFFSRPYERQTATNKFGDGMVYNYNLIMVPNLAYRVSDPLSVIGALAYSFQNLRLQQNWYDLNHEMATLQLGVGWSVTREIYLHPHMSVFIESPGFNTTSFNLNAVVSVF